MRAKAVISFTEDVLQSLLNSYSVIFFSNNRLFAILILIVSFFNPFAGFAGITATIIALVAAYAIGFSKEQVKTGLYSYSSLLLGLGMGAFYETSPAFWVLLTLSSLLAMLLSVALLARLSRERLPALSLGFIFSFWLVILASKEFSAIGLTQRNIYWLNEMYATGGNRLIQIFMRIENLQLHEAVAGFFRSLSAVIFQSNIAAGILLSIGLLLSSRIAFVLMIAGYSVAMLFNDFMGGYNVVGVNYYNLGTNFMLVAVAIGGFYVIPSVRSFFWALVAVPVSYMLVVALGKITYTWGLPVFSLPFCFVVILFLYCLTLRTHASKLVLTPIQYYNPEVNLYRYINGRERLQHRYYFQMFLPFIGEWMVSQGYDGKFTHKGDWGKALDFVILDSEMKTFTSPATQPEHFYCYNKPVISPADGVVQEVLDYVEDNNIGDNNTGENWGNSIVIKHADNLYTKLSHLRKNSFRVNKGAFVKKGDIIAACGNSGRSPEPHLHFQVQSTPFIGSKTTAYPLAYYISREQNGQQLESFHAPKEGQFVSNITPNTQLQKAFNFQPGYRLTVSATGFKTEEWEVQTSVYNESYLYCKECKAYAYFIYTDTLFYFTDYFGSKKTLLYHFYLAAYKVLLSTEKAITVKDTYPLNIFGNYALRWLQDFIAPFHVFIRINYESSVQSNGGLLSTEQSFVSKQTSQVLWDKRNRMQAEVAVNDGQLQSFIISTHTKKIEARCEPYKV